MSHRWRYYKGFWRFQNIAVPQGATIDSAYLQLGWDNGSERTFKVIALASGNAPQPTDNTYANHSLETTASVDWTIPYHAEGVTINHTSPSINNIIQAIVTILPLIFSSLISEMTFFKLLFSSFFLS